MGGAGRHRARIRERELEAPRRAHRGEYSTSKLNSSEHAITVPGVYFHDPRSQWGVLYLLLVLHCVLYVLVLNCTRNAVRRYR